MIRPILLLLSLIFAAPAAAQTFPPLAGRVVDQANIIPDDREVALVQRLEELQRTTSRQLVVATVASLEGHEIEDYGYRLGRHWQIGQSEANNGVILLVAPTERRVRIEVGYGLEPIITDALSSQIINREIVPRFRENDYAGGIEAGANALIAQLAAPPEAAERAALEAERARQSERSGGGSADWIILLVIGGFIVFIFIGALADSARGRRGRASPWGPRYERSAGSDIGWFVAGAVLESLLRGGRGGGSSWGGGGWGGGDGGGGGGGGFSGGGGSFGGGGASGSW